MTYLYKEKILEIDVLFNDLCWFVSVNFWLSEAAATIPADSTDYNETYIFNIGKNLVFNIFNYNPSYWRAIKKDLNVLNF